MDQALPLVLWEVEDIVEETDDAFFLELVARDLGAGLRPLGSTEEGRLGENLNMVAETYLSVVGHASIPAVRSALPSTALKNLDILLTVQRSPLIEAVTNSCYTHAAIFFDGKVHQFTTKTPIFGDDGIRFERPSGYSSLPIEDYIKEQGGEIHVKTLKEEVHLDLSHGPEILKTLMGKKFGANVDGQTWGEYFSAKLAAYRGDRFSEARAAERLGLVERLHCSDFVNYFLTAVLRGNPTCRSEEVSITIETLPHDKKIMGSCLPRTIGEPSWRSEIYDEKPWKLSKNSL